MIFTCLSHSLTFPSKIIPIENIVALKLIEEGFQVEKSDETRK